MSRSPGEPCPLGTALQSAVSLQANPEEDCILDIAALYLVSFVIDQLATPTRQSVRWLPEFSRHCVAANCYVSAPATCQVIDLLVGDSVVHHIMG